MHSGLKSGARCRSATGKGRIKRLTPLNPAAKRSGSNRTGAALPRLGPLPDINHVAFRLAVTIRDLRAADLDVTTAELDAAGYSRPDRVKFGALAAAIADALDQAEAANHPIEPPEALEAVYRTRRCAFQ